MHMLIPVVYIFFFFFLSKIVPPCISCFVFDAQPTKHITRGKGQ